MHRTGVDADVDAVVTASSVAPPRADAAPTKRPANMRFMGVRSQTNDGARGMK